MKLASVIAIQVAACLATAGAPGRSVPARLAFIEKFRHHLKENTARWQVYWVHAPFEKVLRTAKRMGLEPGLDLKTRKWVMYTAGRCWMAPHRGSDFNPHWCSFGYIPPQIGIGSGHVQLSGLEFMPEALKYLSYDDRNHILTVESSDENIQELIKILDGMDGKMKRVALLRKADSIRIRLYCRRAAVTRLFGDNPNRYLRRHGLEPRIGE